MVLVVVVALIVMDSVVSLVMRVHWVCLFVHRVQLSVV